MNKLKENFKDILILILIFLLFLTNTLWCIAHVQFIRGYFWSDYNVINSNTNINDNKISKGGD